MRAVLRRRRHLPRLRRRDHDARRRLRRRRLRPGHPGPAQRPGAVPPVHGAADGHAPPRRGRTSSAAPSPSTPTARSPRPWRSAARPRPARASSKEMPDEMRGSSRRDGAGAGRALPRPAPPVVRHCRSRADADRTPRTAEAHQVLGGLLVLRVDARGLEPPTPTVSRWCANQAALRVRGVTAVRVLLEVETGFEPVYAALQAAASPLGHSTVGAAIYPPSG